MGPAHAQGGVAADDAIVGCVSQGWRKTPGHLVEPEADVEEPSLQPQLSIESGEQGVLRGACPGPARQQRVGIGVCGKAERDVAHALEESRHARVAPIDTVEQRRDAQHGRRPVSPHGHVIPPRRPEQPLHDDAVAPLAIQAAMSPIDADHAKSGAFVQDQTRPVLRKDPRDQLPEAARFILPDQGVQRRSACPTPRACRAV